MRDPGGQHLGPACLAQILTPGVQQSLICRNKLVIIFKVLFNDILSFDEIVDFSLLICCATMPCLGRGAEHPLLVLGGSHAIVLPSEYI